MLRGKELSQGVVGITHFNISLDQIKKLAKDKQCSLSVLLVAMQVFSIYEENYRYHKDKKPLNVCIPIDLKKYFESDTISNFVSYMVASLNLRKHKTYTFEDILVLVNEEFQKKLQFNKVVATMSSNGKMVNSFFIRSVPLILKKIMVVLGTLEFKRHFSTTFSNIGVFELDEKYRNYVENYYFILAPDWAEKIRCGVVSFKENLVVTFGSNLANANVEKRFKKILDKYKIKYTIETNDINSIKK